MTTSHETLSELILNIMTTQVLHSNKLINYLERNQISYNIDRNPSEEKISKIENAILRKKEILEEAVRTYKRVFSV